MSDMTEMAEQLQELNAYAVKVPDADLLAGLPEGFAEQYPNMTPAQLKWVLSLKAKSEQVREYVEEEGPCPGCTL